MIRLMTSTAIAMAAAFAANAQDVSYSISTDSITGTTLLPSGMTSAASVGLSGFGAGGVVVSNSGLQLNLAPEVDADAASDFMYWAEDSDIDGVISVENERSVEVSGVLSGIGTVVGTGTTTTTFDAQMIAGASVEQEASEDFGGDDGTVGLSANIDGLARLAGESTSTAGMQMVGQTAGFIGELGTTVGGDFTALAFFDTDNDYNDSSDIEDFEIESDGVSGIVIDARTDDINLAVASLGGGTLLLTGANSDLFEGGTLLENGGDWFLEFGGAVCVSDCEP